MPASRSWPRLGLAIATFMLLVACSIAVWRNKSAPGSAASPAGVSFSPPGSAPDAGAPPRRRADAGLAPPAQPTFPPYVARADEDAPIALPIENPDRLDYYFSKL